MPRLTRSPDPAVPGADLVTEGLEDLRLGRRSEAAMLVCSAAPRLRALGYGLPTADVDDPDGQLYELVRRRVGSARAHSTYNALRRRMISFLNSSRS